MSDVLPRHLRPRIIEALADTRVVLVQGARQVGKSTLALQVAHDLGMDRVTLDDSVALDAARRDPTGFVGGLRTPVLIDEVQRVPELLLAIKRSVDDNPIPGRYLLTGSANVFSSRRTLDALTGRVAVLHLHALTQSEIHASPRPGLIDALFRAEPPRVRSTVVGRDAFVNAIAAGGYPEAIRRAAGRRRDEWFASYLISSIERDLKEFADARRTAEIPKLLRLLASRSANQLVLRNIAKAIDIHHQTIASYIGLLESLFLVTRLRPWRPGLGAREGHAPKVYITDTGLLAHLLGADATRIGNDDQVTGLALETLVAVEILAQLDWSETDAHAYHYRDDRHEIDLILENRAGEVVAIEVKATASLPNNADRTLRRLRDTLGPRFRAGVIIHTGRETIPLGDRLWALPLNALWTP